MYFWYCIMQKKAYERAAPGYRSTLRIALSDDAVTSYLSAILTHWRVNVPDVAIRVAEVPLLDQLRGLRSYFFDVEMWVMRLMKR